MDLGLSLSTSPNEINDFVDSSIGEMQEKINGIFVYI